MKIDDVIAALTEPKKLYSCADVLGASKPVPKKAGFCAVYFKKIPTNVPTDGCVTKGDKTLLYIGVGGLGESSSLRTRIRQHYKSTARQSTLRTTLGVILYGQDSTPLRMVSENEPGRFELTDSYEEQLTAWIKENVFVCWVEHENPASIKIDVIHSGYFPLNIQHNKHHSFPNVLSKMRTKAQREAQELDPKP